MSHFSEPQRYDQPALDQRLPTVVTALDTVAMRLHLQQALGGESAPMLIHNCEIKRVKYKPGKNCLVCYRLQGENRLSGREAEQIITARVYPMGESDTHYEKAQKQLSGLAQLGPPPVLHLPNLNMVAWLFPHDRKLDGLLKLCDPAALRYELLPPIVAQHWGGEWQIAAVTPQLVHYAPEYTCTVRVQLHLHHAASGASEEVVFFGKSYDDERGTETNRLMNLLWDGESRRQGCLGMAQPLGYQAGPRIFWQRGLNGQPLQQIPVQSERFLPLMAAAARSLAALHQSPIVCQQSSDLADWVQRLTSVPALVAQVWPEGEAQAARLVALLQQQTADLGEQPVALLHGDLHLQNFFVEQAQDLSGAPTKLSNEHRFSMGAPDRSVVSLIDMDNLHNGSPWQDVGSFLAGLEYTSLREDTSTECLQMAARHFRQVYQQQTDWPRSSCAITWYTAAALLNERAYRSVSRLKGGRIDLLPALFQRVEQLIG